MKLCLIFPHYPPNYRPGGIEDYSKILVEKFRRMGIDTFVIASGQYTGTDEKVFKVGGTEWGWRALRDVIQIIRREKFDMVLQQYTPDCYGFGLSFKLLPLCLKFIKHPPFFVTTFHTLVGGPWVSRLHALLLTLFSHQVVSTNEDLTFLFKKYFWVFRHKLAQIPIGSNIKRLITDKTTARAQAAQTFSVDPNKIWLSNFGFTIPNKGIENLLESLALLKSRGQAVHLFMISALRNGDEPYRATLLDLAEKRNITDSITWINEASPEDISRWLCASDIFVVPYKDGICTRRGTLIAGITHHKPIISTHPRVPTPYFKHEENVLLVPPEDKASLAEAIERLSHDEALKTQLSTRIAATEKYFDWDMIAYQTIRLYGQAGRKISERVRRPIKLLVETLEALAWNSLLHPQKKKNHPAVDLSRMSSPEKILLIQLNSIGDVLMTTPALNSLRKKYPTVQIDILTLPHTGVLLKGNPDINRIFTCDKNFWRTFPFKWREFSRSRQTLKQIKKENYDIAVDFNGTFESVMLTTFLTKKIKIGLRQKLIRGLYRDDSSAFYSVTVPVQKNQHIVENNLSLVKTLGAEGGEPRATFIIQKEDQKEAEDFLSRHQLKVKNFIVIHPGAKWPPKRWPARHFAQLIDALKQELSLKTILVGSREDHRLLDEIKNASQAEPVLSPGTLGLSVLAAVVKMSALFIGNDSGLSHLAGAVNTPTLVLFGPTNPALCLPRGDNVNFLRKDWPCWPCTLYYRRNNCEMGTNFCLAELNPKSVMETGKQHLCA